MNTSNETEQKNNSDDANKDAWKLAYTIQGSVIIILNSFAIILILIRQNLRRKLSNKFLCSLLFVHLIFGIFDLIFGFTMMYNEKEIVNVSNMKERIQNHALDCITSIVISLFLNLMLVTIDRLAAIKYPFKYIKVSTKHGILVLVIIWLVSLSYIPISIACEHPRVSADIVTFTLTIVSFLTLAISNGIVYNIVRKQIKEISKTIIEVPNKTGINSQKESLQQQKLKSFYICLVMVLSFIIFWTPIIIFDFLKFYDQDVVLFGRIAVFIVFFNSIADPIIYCMMNHELKSEIRKVLRIPRRMNSTPKTQSSAST